jgi:hypothetical protein
MMIAGFMLWFSLSLGLQNGNITMPYDSYTFPNYYSNIELHAENDWLDIYTVYRNEMNKATSFKFAPATDYFTVGARVTLGQVSLSAEHQCIHPVLTRGYSPDKLYGGYNRVEVTITSKP